MINYTTHFYVDVIAPLSINLCWDTVCVQGILGQYYGCWWTNASLRWKNPLQMTPYIFKGKEFLVNVFLKYIIGSTESAWRWKTFTGNQLRSKRRFSGQWKRMLPFFTIGSGINLRATIDGMLSSLQEIRWSWGGGEGCIVTSGFEWTSLYSLR